MFPSRCSHEPCMNIDVRMRETWEPPSVTQARPLPISTAVPGGSAPVSSPGISPKLQTEAGSAGSVPALCTTSQTAMLAAMISHVTTAVRCVLFSSWYGNIRVSQSATVVPPGTQCLVLVEHALHGAG